MSPLRKLELAMRIWWLSIVVGVRSRRDSLPQLVTDLTRVERPRRRYPPDAVRMGQIVTRVLTTPAGPPRCLIAALVAFRLHRLEGRPVELVIGLPKEPEDQDAHAWLELGGRDIGPPPGRHGHEELTRYR